MIETHDQAAVVEQPAAHRFIIPIRDDAVSAAYYAVDRQGRYVLTHTEVPSEFMGQGIATSLARGVFETARARGLKLVLACPFMAAWFAKHPDYTDVVAG